MLTAAEFVARALAKVQPVLVPRRLSPEAFAASVLRVQPRAERAVQQLFEARPWAGWLTRDEREALKGFRVQRRTPWPRDPRMVPFSLNQQARILAFHYNLETIARGPETRTVRVSLMQPAVEIATVRLHAFDPPTKRVRGGTSADRRDDLERHLRAAAETEVRKFPPLDGTILEVLDGGAWVRASFGGDVREVPAHDLMLLDEDPDFLQDQVLRTLLFGEAPGTRDKRAKFVRMTGRQPEAGAEHVAGPYRALWPTGAHEVYLFGPFEPGVHGLLLHRNGFTSRGKGYVQRANDRTWAKAKNVLNRIEAGAPPPPSARGTGEVSLPKFGSVAGWLDALPAVRARGERALGRYIEALEKSSLVNAAPGPDLNALANALPLLQLRLDFGAISASKNLALRIADAQATAAAIVPGKVGMVRPERSGLWTIGRQGVYVVVQPPTRDVGKAHEPAFRRAGFKRRGGGFARLLADRDQPDDTPLEREEALARGLARVVLGDEVVDERTLGEQWAEAELGRASRDSRLRRGPDALAVAAANRKAARRRPEAAVWQAAIDWLRGVKNNAAV